MQHPMDAAIGPQAGQAEPSTRGAVAAYRRLMQGLDATARGVLFVVLLAELGLILFEVGQRMILGQSFLWAEEISRLALLTLAFVGGALAYRSGQHTAVAVLMSRLPEGARDVVRASADLVVLCIAAVGLSSAFDLFGIDAESIMPMLQWNLGLTVVPFAVGFVLIGLFAIEQLLERRGRGVLPAAILVPLLGAIVYGIGQFPATQLTSGVALIAMLVVFFASILLGLPVAFAMLLGSVLFLVTTNQAPLIAIAQNTIDGSGHFILLTLPFFIWAGMIMEKGGISRRLVSFAMALVGHFRGGLLQVVVLTTYLVSGVSGSKVADVVAVGSVMREELERKGYRLKEGAAVLAASTAMSETIPPSIAMLVLGSVVPVSVGAMFIAGLLPAMVLAVILMVLVFVLAVRHDSPVAPRAARSQLAAAAVGAVLPLLMPAILVLGIKFGIATPTEVSSVGVLYGLILCLAVYRSIGLRDFVRVAIDSAKMSGMVLFIIAAAGSFAWILAAGDLPQYLSSLLKAVGDNRYLFLAVSIVIMILVSSLLEGLPALIILGPMLYPIAVSLHVDGVHFAMVLLLSMGVGIFMPPLGVGFYVTCSVMQTSIEETSRAFVPYLIALLIGILVVAAVPWFSLVVIDLLGR